MNDINYQRMIGFTAGAALNHGFVYMGRTAVENGGIQAAGCCRISCVRVIGGEGVIYKLPSATLFIAKIPRSHFNRSAVGALSLSFVHPTDRSVMSTRSGAEYRDDEGWHMCKCACACWLHDFVHSFPCLYQSDGILYSLGNHVFVIFAISRGVTCALSSVVPVVVSLHQLSWFTNPGMYLFHIPQRNIQNRNVHISALNVALWDMKHVYSGICEIGPILRVS